MTIANSIWGLNMHWNQGYVSDIDYTYGYYSELNPLQTKLKLIYAGIKPPEVKTACELGFGQGVSLLCNAAASEIEWYGNDFNPNQVSFVNQAVRESGLGLNVSDESFEQFCTRKDLPNFDFISLHGIWSWISDANREIISRFIAEKLNVGGVLYISYNSEPGRAAMRPFREMMEWHANSLSAPDTPILDKIDASITFMRNLLGTDPVYKKAYPGVEPMLEELSKKDKRYLAHEFFNADWTTMSVKKLSEMLSDCKLQFAASAHPLELLPNINFTKQQLELIQTINDPIFREYVKDFCLNQDFRRDLWVKGGRTLSATERMNEFLSLPVTLMTPASEITFDVKTASGDATLAKEVYAPVVESLSGRSSIKLSEVAHEVKIAVNLIQLFEVCIVLAGKGALCVAQEDSVAKRVKSTSLKLNKFFKKCSSYENKVSFLVSPISSTAISVNRFEQLFLSALEENLSKPEELAKFVWERLKLQGEKIVSNGKVMQSDEDNIKYLVDLATKFLSSKLPELNRLKVQ